MATIVNSPEEDRERESGGESCWYICMIPLANAENTRAHTQRINNYIFKIIIYKQDRTI